MFLTGKDREVARKAALESYGRDWRFWLVLAPKLGVVLAVLAALVGLGLGVQFIVTHWEGWQVAAIEWVAQSMAFMLCTVIGLVVYTVAAVWVWRVYGFDIRYTLGMSRGVYTGILCAIVLIVFTVIGVAS